MHVRKTHAVGRRTRLAQRRALPAGGLVRRGHIPCGLGPRQSLRFGGDRGLNRHPGSAGSLIALILCSFWVAIVAHFAVFLHVIEAVDRFRRHICACGIRGARDGRRLGHLQSAAGVAGATWQGCGKNAAGGREVGGALWARVAPTCDSSAASWSVAVILVVGVGRGCSAACCWAPAAPECMAGGARGAAGSSIAAAGYRQASQQLQCFYAAS
eukprot:COSAG01_NODE_12348_length_1754_cov_5.155891_1_plen_213_part_00